ncbi:DUF6098 family protein, partial [Streptomyces sp. NPDC057148]
MRASDGLPVVRSLEELTDLVPRHRGLYVRWSRGPGTDLADVSSTDDLTGVPMPGLSAGSLGPVVKFPPARRRLARTLAALPNRPRGSATRT